VGALGGSRRPRFGGAGTVTAFLAARHISKSLLRGKDGKTVDVRTKVRCIAAGLALLALGALLALPRSPWSVFTRPRCPQVHFYRPKTLKLARKPRYERALPASAVSKMDKYAIIKAPVATDAAMQKIETHNTLVFLCDKRANKTEIRKAVSDRFKVSVEKVNTLIRPDGQKKAYVRLTKDHDALHVANTIGIV
jgi:large subunit ribosomal protein L23Ae